MNQQAIAEREAETMPARPNSNSPFGSQLPARTAHNAVADAGQQREIAEVQAAMVIAKRFPRDQIEATDRILAACTRPTLAEGALYSYSRGGSEISGPSIRLAEACAQAWGNVQFGIRELEQSNGSSTVEAFAWDIETNTRQVKVFQVEHKRHTRKGSYKLEDPRDIYELIANNGARRLRACILGVIPGDVIEAAVKQCEETLTANADTSPEGIKKLVDAFAGFGVTQEQIEKRIQRRMESIRPAQVMQLRKVYTSLKDGMSQPADWFEGDGTAARDVTADITGKTEDKPKAKAKDKQPEPKDAPIDAEALAQQIHDAMAAATTRKELDKASVRIAELPEDMQGPLNEQYEDLAMSLAGV